MNRSTTLLVAVVVGLILIFSTFFIVHQTEQVLITRFGEPVRLMKEPGLKAKIPFIDTAITFDKRLLEFNGRPQEINMVDEEGSSQRVVVDAFVKYRIVKPLQFYQSVRNEQIFNERLQSILSGSMREVLGQVSLSDLLSENRVAIMRDIRQEVNRRLVREAREVVVDPAAAAAVGAAAEDAAEAAAPVPQSVRDGFGIDVIDVRINRADLPDQISESVFNRMRADFAEEAQKFRSEGQEESLRISSTAERERTAILAEANRLAEEVRGRADADATRIFAEAFNRDPEFFEFYRTLQTYRDTLKGADTRLVLSPDSEFLRLFDEGD